MKELSEQTKAEMRRGQRALRDNHAIDIFNNKLQVGLNHKIREGWRISDKTYCAPDEQYRVYVHVYPRNGEMLEFVEHEEDFPSEMLVAQIFLLLG
jgi:hypothetical protein